MEEIPINQSHYTCNLLSRPSTSIQSPARSIAQFTIDNWHYNLFQSFICVQPFVTNITIVLVFNKVTLQSTHWSIQTLFISGGDSSCSWVFYSCTGPKCGVGVDLVDCNAVGGGHVATSIDQSVRISACGALALEEYKRSASVQPLLCNS